MRRLLLTLKIMFGLNAARYGQIHGYSGSDQPPSDCRDNVRNIEWAVAKNYIFTNNWIGPDVARSVIFVHIHHETYPDRYGGDVASHHVQFLVATY